MIKLRREGRNHTIMEMSIKKRRGILNWIIPLHFLFLFALVSCGKSIDKPLSPSSGPSAAVHQKMKKEFGKAVQTATRQFTTELGKALVKATTEFHNQTEKFLKKMERGVQVKLDREAFVSDLDTSIQKTRDRFTTDINKILDEALVQFRSQVEEIRAEEKTDAATMKAEAKEVISWFNEEVRKTISQAPHIIQEPIKASELSDPMTEARNKAQFIIQSVVKNLRPFLDRELLFESASGTKKGVVKQIFEDMEIKWEQVVTEQEKTDLADKIMSTIYSDDEQYKYGLKNIHTALMINLTDIKVPEEDTVMLTANEKVILTNEFSIEVRQAVEKLIEERIRYNVDKIIDIETAAEAVYTLQFDVKSSLPHKIFGKPIQLFISMREGEDSQSVVLWRKGDCVRIKKEHLPSVTLVLLYTNPAIAMNVPNPMFQLCGPKEEKYRCHPGNYNIQRVGEEEGIDYVLSWEKQTEDNIAFSCQTFPSMPTL